MKACGNKIGMYDCCSVIRGDAHALLSTLPDESVGAIITDPPYGVGAALWDGRVPYELLPSFRRISKGVILWFGAAPQIIEAAKSFDESPQRILIWAPAFTLSRTRSEGIAFRYHPIFAWRLPKIHDGPTWDLLDHNTECGNWWHHPCTKPFFLMRDLCGFAPQGSLILDPFCGSGTTLVAAAASGHHFLGFEINEEYACIAEARLNGEQIFEGGRQQCLFN